MIEVINLSKRFGETVALDELSFRARDGRIMGLLGPNGAGKTTAMRILYGLLKADAGMVTIDGIDVAKNKLEAGRRLGALPDVQGLYPRLTARENIQGWSNPKTFASPLAAIADKQTRQTAKLVIGPATTASSSLWGS